MDEELAVMSICLLSWREMEAFATYSSAVACARAASLLAKSKDSSTEEVLVKLAMGLGHEDSDITPVAGELQDRY